MSLIIKDVFIENKGDLGGHFALTISGPEESVLKYVKNIDDRSFYFSAHVNPNFKDMTMMKKIDERHQRLMEDYRSNLIKRFDEVRSYLQNANPSDIEVYDVDRFIAAELISNPAPAESSSSEVEIIIDPDFSIEKAENIVFSVSNNFIDSFNVSTGYTSNDLSGLAAFKISDSPYAQNVQNVRALAAATATISSEAHLYVLNGSYRHNKMTASADPDNSLDIGIELYRTGESFPANRRGPGVEESTEGRGGKNNWRFKIYKSSAVGGDYTYNSKWSRT